MESVQELCQAMEPLATFTDAEVLGDNPPSNWQMITLSSPTELEHADQGNQRERSHSGNWGAHARGTFVAACGVGCSKLTFTTWAASPSLAPIQKAGSAQEGCHGQQLAPPPGFTEIARSLCGDNLPHKVMSIPLELAGDQGTMWIGESMVSSAQLCQDSLSGATCINVMTCSMSLVGLGLLPQWVITLCPLFRERRTWILTKSPLPVTIAHLDW